MQLPSIFEASRLSLWSLSSIQEQKAYTRYSMVPNWKVEKGTECLWIALFNNSHSEFSPTFSLALYCILSSESVQEQEGGKLRERLWSKGPPPLCYGPPTRCYGPRSYAMAPKEFKRLSFQDSGSICSNSSESLYPGTSAIKALIIPDSGCWVETTTVPALWPEVS